MDINTKIRIRQMKELNARRGIFLDLTYIDITGDIICGVLLSQLVYWFSNDDNGKSKLRVRKNGRYWLAKSKSEWYEETRLSRKQIERAEKILKQMGIIEVKVFKFNGNPTNHYWFNWEKFIEIEEDSLLSRGEMEMSKRGETDSPKGEERKDQKVTFETDEKVQTLGTKSTVLSTPKVTLENAETEQSITYTTTETTSYITTENTDRETSSTSTPIGSVQDVLNFFKSEINDVSYKTWIEPNIGQAYVENEELVIPCCNTFSKDILEKRYIPLIPTNSFKGHRLIEAVQ